MRDDTARGQYARMADAYEALADNEDRLHRQN
jgi:hypothetical protein